MVKDTTGYFSFLTLRGITTKLPFQRIFSIPERSLTSRISQLTSMVILHGRGAIHQLHTPNPGCELSSVTALQSSLDLLRVHNTSVNWKAWTCFNAGKIREFYRLTKANIVFVLNWTSPDSSNTALAIGSLGYSGATFWPYAQSHFITILMVACRFW